MKSIIQMLRKWIIPTALVSGMTVPAIAGAQCQNKTGFAKDLCEARSLATPTPAPGKPAASATNAAADVLTTGISDAVETDTLDASLSPKALKSFTSLGRSADGSFILERGMYEAIFESYCLDTGARAVTGFAGYLPAPIKGTKANLIGVLLKYAELHPEVGQAEIQQVFTGLVSGANFGDWPLAAQKAASAILPPDLLQPLQAAQGKRSGQKLLNELSRRLDKAAAMNPNLKNAKDAKDTVMANFPDAPQPAAAAPVAPTGAAPDAMVVRGTWAEMPGGFYLRYLPEGTAHMRIQLFVPDMALKAAGAASITFDPTQYLAVLSQAPYARIGITVRQNLTARR